MEVVSLFPLASSLHRLPIPSISSYDASSSPVKPESRSSSISYHLVNHDSSHSFIKVYLTRAALLSPSSATAGSCAVTVGAAGSGVGSAVPSSAGCGSLSCSAEAIIEVRDNLQPLMSEDSKENQTQDLARAIKASEIIADSARIFGILFAKRKGAS